MSGKPPLAILLVDDLAALWRMFRAALTDEHSPGVIDATEALPLLRLVAHCHKSGQRVDLEQRQGISQIRYGQPARDHDIERRDLDRDWPPAA